MRRLIIGSLAGLMLVVSGFASSADAHWRFRGHYGYGYPSYGYGYYAPRYYYRPYYQPYYYNYGYSPGYYNYSYGYGYPSYSYGYAYSPGFSFWW